jgi:hypothetical protein
MTEFPTFKKQGEKVPKFTKKGKERNIVPIESGTGVSDK